ncbi:ornithine cyclodeaminase family protein [Humibacillus sp. DSM 29435]|uniref:ornithine cyclodeaminase family protein n=1 Tax=Humibacillus sp. DSM 29435 TaxID=1869167 RepID=UPI002111D7F2|nr:ornithine cyclodeaminase family protein [Humibacillus sp. DSM 29435]
MTRSDLTALTDMATTIEAVQRAMADLERNHARQPTPQGMTDPGSDGVFLPMAALSRPSGLACVKLLADLPGNSARGLPGQRSTLMLADVETGETLAILDGMVPTRVRTAATSAVATRHLAAPDARSLGLIGAGALAVAHVEALSHVMPLEEVMFWTRSERSAVRFREAVAGFGVRAMGLTSPQEVVERAEVVCTLTPSVEPLVRGAWLHSGQHLNVVGARPRPDHREVDAETMVRSSVFVDSLPTALAKSGDLLGAIKEGALGPGYAPVELGAVIIESAPGRQYPSEITLYDSVGLGLQDLAIGRLLYDAALDQGVGLRVDLSA